MYDEVLAYIRSIYGGKDFIPLHEPKFFGNEKKYVLDAIDSTFVSSVGEYVDRFEAQFAQFVASKYAVATVNGTAALHTALHLLGVASGDEVITQALTFVATCNAIKYCGAQPVFIDICRQTLSLSPQKLEAYLLENTIQTNGNCINKETGKVLKACIVMHTMGHPADMNAILTVCGKHNIKVVEDAAEALGSYEKNKHMGTLGDIGCFSFNGNKVMTTGGGGMIVTDNESLAIRAKHITTTAKVKHQYQYVHDEVGFNYRMPNLNAALGCAQLEVLPEILKNKRERAMSYKEFFKGSNIKFVEERATTHVNYWLNAVFMEDRNSRDAFLEYSNSNGVMTRPVWELMHSLPMYLNCPRGEMQNSEWVRDHLVNIPSSVVLN